LSRIDDHCFSQAQLLFSWAAGLPPAQSGPATDIHRVQPAFWIHCPGCNSRAVGGLLQRLLERFISRTKLAEDKTTTATTMTTTTTTTTLSNQFRHPRRAAQRRPIIGLVALRSHPLSAHQRYQQAVSLPPDSATRPPASVAQASGD